MCEMPGSGLPCSPSRVPWCWIVSLRQRLQAFVREEIDLNRDGTVTRYKVYAGLAKLIRREQWHDTYANGLWVIPAA